MPLSRKAGKSHRDQVACLPLSETSYSAHAGKCAVRSRREPPTVRFVPIENDSTVADGMIRDRLHQKVEKVGEPLDRLQPEKDISSVYGMDLFQYVH